MCAMNATTSAIVIALSVGLHVNTVLRIALEVRPKISARERRH